MNNIRIARKSMKLTQGQLAAFLGITPAQVSQYECGYRRPSQDMLTLIASALRTNELYLTGRPLRAPVIDGGIIVMLPIMRTFITVHGEAAVQVMEGEKKRAIYIYKRNGEVMTCEKA